MHTGMPNDPRVPPSLRGFPVPKDRVVEPRKLVSKQKAKARKKAKAQRKARKITRRAGR